MGSEMCIRDRIARCPIVKNENLDQKGSLGGDLTILRNFGTPSISRKAEARNSKFDMHNDCEASYRKKMKIGVKRGLQGSRDDHFGGILGPPPYLGNGSS